MSSPIQGQFICPILQNTMTDPVVAQDGYTYERSAIQAWFNSGNRTSPMTREIISTSLLNNHTMRSEMAVAGLVLRSLGESSFSTLGVGVLQGHAGWVRAVAVFPDGKYVLTGSEDKTARVWDLETEKTIRVLKGHANGVIAAAVSPDGRYVVTGSWDRTARVWNFETGETARVLEGHTGWVFAVAVSPDGKYVVTGSDDGTARVWDIETGETVRVLKGHTRWVRAVAVFPDGKYVVTGSEDKTARVWNFETGETVKQLKGHTSYVTAVAVSPDGKYVVTGSDDKTVRVWNLETAGSEGNEGSANLISYIVNLGLWLWLGRAKNGETVRVLKGHTEYVNAVAVSPDGKYVVTGSDDKTIRVWNLETVGNEDIVDSVTVLEGNTGYINAVAMSPNGKYVVTGCGDKTARIWNL